MDTPKLVTLVGYPAVGKSTYAKKLEQQGYALLSGDRVLEHLREKYNLATVDDAYDAHRDELNSIMADQLAEAVEHGKSIVADSFNLTKRHRARPLDAVKNSAHPYECTAIIFYPPEAEEHAKRLGERVFRRGQMKMADGLQMAAWEDSYEPPSCEEGFQHIRTIGKPPQEALMSMER